MSASTGFSSPIGGERDGSDDDDQAIRVAHSRALLRLRSSVEHLLQSPLNSIGLNLELLAVEISDLAKRGADAQALSGLENVLSALRGGYARLIGSSATVLETVIPTRGERVEALDLASLARRVAGLGATEAVLLRAAWQTEIPPDGSITIESRRDLLVPALLSLAGLALEQAGESARIGFSVSASSDTAEVKVEVEPCREADRDGSAQEIRNGLARLADRLGGSCQESVVERVFRIHLSLPRLFGAA